uniref:Uncharacterized protein n=1 Tax=uncultured marine virus TaxID=186617 RepID=A0A0F7L5G3_9VIRU|nr:hypothetical protein [uncultured marine virus]
MTLRSRLVLIAFHNDKYLKHHHPQKHYFQHKAGTLQPLFPCYWLCLLSKLETIPQ